MELLETQYPEKKKLIESSERHRRALEKEVTDISDKTGKTIRNVLIIAGSLALTYFVVRSLSGSKTKKKARKDAETDTTSPEKEATKESPSILSAVGNQILTQATLILLTMAKDKLVDYLNSRKQTDENS